jgi:hypothetical protein
VSSVDPTPSLVVIVVSGDIAFSGDLAECSQASDFFTDLRGRLQELNRSAEIAFACVPGNHDCVLTKEGAKLRATLVQGISPSMQDAQQDPALLASLLEAQKPYAEFREQLMRDAGWDGVCQSLLIEHQTRKIQLNLYNTAILSMSKGPKHLGRAAGRAKLDAFLAAGSGQALRPAKAAGLRMTAVGTAGILRLREPICFANRLAALRMTPTMGAG